jgi:methionyl-tRNA formyltransferase
MNTMKKSIPISNGFCPQTLFLYGTYNVCIACGELLLMFQNVRIAGKKILNTKKQK